MSPEKFFEGELGGVLSWGLGWVLFLVGVSCCVLGGFVCWFGWRWNILSVKLAYVEDILPDHDVVVEKGETWVEPAQA